MGTALNRGRSLAGAVTRASVNKGAGRSARRACPREGAGPRGSGAHACGRPFSGPPRGGAAGKRAWGACPGFYRRGVTRGGRKIPSRRRRVQGLGARSHRRDYLSAWESCGGGGGTLGFPGA